MFAEGSDQFKLVDKVCKTKDDKERHKSTNKSINENVLNIFEELFFF